jgi:hypothetical protein
LILFSGEIDHERRETYDIERGIRVMQNDMLKLNQLMHKQSGTHHELRQDNILLENDFISALKVCFLLDLLSLKLQMCFILLLFRFPIS